MQRNLAGPAVLVMVDRRSVPVSPPRFTGSSVDVKGERLSLQREQRRCQEQGKTPAHGASVWDNPFTLNAPATST
jgi:hypothetical protein